MGLMAEQSDPNARTPACCLSKGNSPIDLARLLDESCDQDHNQGTLAMAANDNKEEDLNVFGERLASCSVDPVDRLLSRRLLLDQR